jgi:hypothetical protein
MLNNNSNRYPYTVFMQNESTQPHYMKDGAWLTGKEYAQQLGWGEDRLASHLLLPWFVETSQKGLNDDTMGLNLWNAKGWKLEHRG